MSEARTPEALTLAAFAATGEPKSPFARAMMRAWPRIESVVIDILEDEFVGVLTEECGRAKKLGEQEGFQRGLRYRQRVGGK